MATYFPHSTESLERLYGIGQAKAARYADIFLPIIAAYCREKGLQENPKPLVAPNLLQEVPILAAGKSANASGTENR